MTSWVPFPDTLVKEAVAAYKAGESAPSISLRLDCSKTAIYGWLAEAGVPRRRSYLKAGIGSLKLSDEVLTPEWLTTEAGAWALGMHVTDGHLRQPRGRPGQSPSPSMRLALKAADRDGVRALCSAYGIDASKIRDSDGMAVLDFAHPRLSFLAELGQPIGRKTADTALPRQLTGSAAAWRGVMDGDGYVSLLRPARRQPQLHAGLRTERIALRDQFTTWAVATLGSAKGVCVHARGVTLTNYAAMRLIGALYLTARYTIPRKRAKALRLAVEYGNAVTPPVAEVLFSALMEAIAAADLEAAA